MTLLDRCEPVPVLDDGARSGLAKPNDERGTPWQLFALQLDACRRQVLLQCSSQPAPYPAYTLFFSVADATRRAHVVHASEDDLTVAWSVGVAKLRSWMSRQALDLPVLRVDWVEGARAVSWANFNAQLDLTRRNHFRMGLALDSDFVRAFTEQELNARGMLDDGPALQHAAVHVGRFRRYAAERFGAGTPLTLPPSGPAYLLATRGVFCGTDGVAHLLAGSGLDAGRRALVLDADALLALVEHGTDQLARRVGPGGEFITGPLSGVGEREPPRPHRPVGPLDTLVDAWEVTRDAALRAAIERAVQRLADTGIRRYAVNARQSLAFVVDDQCIRADDTADGLLALLRYSEATGCRRWLALIDELATGLLRLQDANTGAFSGVLDANDLRPTTRSTPPLRDGSAAYALLRTYAFTLDPRCLDAAQRAVDHLIDADRWQLDDARQCACAAELVRWRPEARYFRLGLLNLCDQLDAVLDRKTSDPVLLEVMLAAHPMLARLDGLPALKHLGRGIDRPKFERALTHRANYQLNGFFWPETAMYFERPSSIEGAFFLRHRGFEVDLHDIGSSLAGLLGYRRWLLAGAANAPCAASQRTG